MGGHVTGLCTRTLPRSPCRPYPRGMESLGESGPRVSGEATGGDETAPSHSALGQHLFAEFHGASNLYDPEPARAVLHEAAAACGATVLGVHLHDFGARAGFTGIAVLAESHISLHSWPEHGYLAIDVFVCGGADPRPAVDVLARHFRPESRSVEVIARGLPPRR